MMRNMLAKGAVAALFLTAGFGVAVGAAQVELYYFWSATCPDCQVMWEFLRGLQEEHPELRILDYEVTFNPDNWRLMVALAQAYELEHRETPMVVVGELAVAGIGRAVELQIREEVARCLVAGCPSPRERLPERANWVLSPLEFLLVALLFLGVLLYMTD